MKFGDALCELSVPQWRSYNIDYLQIKRLIKACTTPGDGNAVAIPGRGSEHLRQVDDQVFGLLQVECNHVSLFVRSKTYEIESRLAGTGRKLAQLQKAVSGTSTSLERGLRIRRKYARLESDIIKIETEVEKIERFATVNSTAVRKLLKKYKKYSGSPELDTRMEEVLNKPDSFAALQTQVYREQCAMFSAQIEAQFKDEPKPSGTADSSAEHGFSSASTLQAASSSDAPSLETPANGKDLTKPRQRYWNEYDYPQSEDGDGFAIYVDPDAPWFPGQHMFSAWREKIRRLFMTQSRPEVAQVDEADVDGSSSSDADEEDNVPLISKRSSRRISGYGALPHYHTHIDHSIPLEASPTTSTLCMLAAVFIIIISAILAVASRKRLRGEVDVAVIVGIVAAICFATVGLVRWWTFELSARAAICEEYHFAVRPDGRLCTEPRSFGEMFQVAMQHLGDVVKLVAFIGVCVAGGELAFFALR